MRLVSALPNQPAFNHDRPAMSADNQDSSAPAAFDAVAITLPQGLIGFADLKAFGLMDLPDEHLAQFKLLQSTSDPNMSFLVVPLDRETGPIAADDLRDAGQSIGMDLEHMAVLAVVTARVKEGAFSPTANLRAPILIDTRNGTGCQFVLKNEKYNIRHDLL